MHFHVSIHQPGYLPTGEVPTFDDDSGAWVHVNEELDRAWDQEYEGASTHAERTAIDDRYIAAYHSTTYKSGAGSLRITGPTATHLGWVYEVMECSEIHEEVGATS